MFVSLVFDLDLASVAPSIEHLRLVPQPAHVLNSLQHLEGHSILRCVRHSPSMLISADEGAKACR